MVLAGAGVASKWLLEAQKGAFCTYLGMRLDDRQASSPMRLFCIRPEEVAIFDLDGVSFEVGRHSSSISSVILLLPAFTIEADQLGRLGDARRSGSY